MTAFQIVVLVMVGIAGLLAAAKQSGEEPATWVPITSTIGGFLAAAGASLQAAGDLSTSTALQAFIAGFGGIGALVAGVGIHHLHTLSKRGPLSPSQPKTPYRTPADPPAAPPAAKRGMLRAALTGAVAALLVAICASQPACKSPVLPIASNVVQVVIDDLQAGDSDLQIAGDVCVALGLSQSASQICSVGAAVVQDIVTYLIDSGTISGAALDNAKSYKARHEGAAGMVRK